MGYETDRAWSDRHIPAIKKIIGGYLLDVASAEVDQRQATDLVIIKDAGRQIACRVRRPGYSDRWPLDFTIRSHRDSGAETELSKMRRGWGDWYFYGHSDNRAPPNIERWFLLDLDVWRKHERNQNAPDKSNRDGTYFRVYRVTDFPQNVIIGCSHKIGWPTCP